MIRLCNMEIGKKDQLRSVAPRADDEAAFCRYEGWEDCLAKVAKYGGLPIVRIERMAKGGNNGTFVFENEEGEKVVGKFYYRDARQRLAREWQGCTFLRKEGFSVPAPLIRNDEKNFGVYSFEEGEHVTSGEASEVQAFGLVDALCRLQDFEPAKVEEEFLNGIASVFSLEAALEDTQKRVEEVRRELQSGGLHPSVVEAIHSSNILDEIEQLAKQCVGAASIPPWHLSIEQARLSTVDFGFHNALFRENGLPCIVDLEYFGWDDPLHAFADFMAHDKTQGLSDALRAVMIDRYSDRRQLSDGDRKRLALLLQLSDIQFIAIYLQSLTPRVLSIRSFAAAGVFDEETYIHQQLEKVWTRREKVRSAMETR
jgi:hypothetical protein